MPIVDTLMFCTSESIGSLRGLKITERSLRENLLSKKLIFHLNLRNLCIDQRCLLSQTNTIGKSTGSITIIHIRSRPGSGTGHLRLSNTTRTAIHQIRIQSSLFETGTLSKRSVVLVVHFPKINLLLILFIHQLRLILVLFTSRHTTSKKITDSTDSA